MKKLPYIEDYVEILGADPLIWPPPDPIIKLARYDEPIVTSMAEQVRRNVAFTDRQSVLAHKIVTKYRKQWATVGYDVSDHIDNPKFKFAIRTIDRRKIIDLDEGEIVIRFPYDQELISKLRSSIDEVPGRLAWNSDKHYWHSPCIESRIIWAREFGSINNFEFSQEFDSVLNLCLSQSDYAIKLVNAESGYAIENAESSMIDYIEAKIGFSDQLKLVDLSSNLAYQVDADIVKSLESQYNPDVVALLLNKTVNYKFTSEVDNFDSVLDYAQLTNRFPVYVYESGSTVLKKQIESRFASEDVLSAGHHLFSPEQIREKYRVVYCSNWKVINHTMPLLVTLHTLTIGIRRQQVADLAEKLVTYTHVVDNDIV